MHIGDPFPASYSLLVQEGYLASSCLSRGLTDLRQGGVHDPGSIYSGLFNVGIGLERLFKMIVVIDHMLSNSMEAPSPKTLKEFGHTIDQLYGEAISIGATYGIAIANRIESDAIDAKLFGVLTKFARTSRYHNLDSLAMGEKEPDPLASWGDIIVEVALQDATQASIKKAIARGGAIADEIEDIYLVIGQGLDKAPMSTRGALILPSIHEIGCKFLAYRMIRFAAPFREVLWEQCGRVYGLREPAPSIPQMHEFFDWLWDDRQSALRKRRWP